MSTTETLCVVFSDIVGSTAKLVAAGDDVAEPMFRNHRESTRRLVSSAGGHHYQWLGDGFTAAFNSTTNAIQVALEVRRMSDGPDPFVSRTGVAVGEVALQADGELFGQTVVVASRLCASAEGGEILCTSLVADLVREVDSISFVDCGHSDLKGIAEPVPTLAVESEPSVATVQPEAAVLFGRSAELNRLTQVVDDASHGRGGLVLIGGEPGAGKTRLAHEVYVAAQHRGFRGVWTTAHAGGLTTALTFANALVGELSESSRAGSPDLVPIAELVAREWRAQEAPTDAVDELTPNERRALSFDALRRLIARVATEQPVMIVFDDLHWADRGAVDLVRFLAQGAPKAGVLLVATYRSTEPASARLFDDILEDSTRAAGHTAVQLGGLTAEDAGGLLDALAGGPLDGAARDYFVEATDGNPFLLAELLRHAAHSGGIVHREGRWALAEDVDRGVPPSVQHQLTARLNRLGEEERELAGWLVAAQRQLAVADLFALCDGETERFASALARATAAGILESRDGRIDFAHPLIRDAVWASTAELTQLVMRRELAQRLARSPDARLRALEIAEHFHATRELGDNETGVEFASLGSDQANEAGDSRTAAELAGLAREMLDPSDPRQSTLACTEALALIWALDDTAADAVIAAADLLERNGMLSDEFLADAVGAARHSYTSIDSLRRIVDRGMVTLGNQISAPASVVRLFDMAFGPESSDYPGIEPMSPLVLDLYRAAEGSPHDVLQRWGHRVGVTVGEHPKDSADPDVRLLYACDLASLPDLERAARRASQIGRFGRSASLWMSAARCAVGRGDLGVVDDMMAAAAENLTHLPPEADVRFHSLAVLDDLNCANGVRLPLDVIRGYETMIPGVSATFMLAGFRSAIARLYAEIGERDAAVELLGSVSRAIELSGPMAATYLRVLWNVAEVVWHLELEDRCADLREAYEEDVLPHDFGTPMTDSNLAVARLAAVSGDMDAALHHFDLAREYTERQGARPMRAICDFDNALALRRVEASTAEVERRVGEARRAFVSYRASAWAVRCDEMLSVD